MINFISMLLIEARRNLEIRFRSGSEIPADFGLRRQAVRKTTVRTREPNGIETFQKSWGELTAVPGVDLVIIQDSGDEYPIKRDIFAETYEETTTGRFRKIARSTLVQVPRDVTAILKTKEGEIKVSHPDFIVIGAQDEVYANNPDWVAENLDFIDAAG